MCGIAGMVGVADRSLLEAMLYVTRHRGPDDSGTYVHVGAPDESVAIGNNRLSIIDLSPAGHQPMTNETESIWVVYNGEIFNFQQLREELVADGHRFSSRTDTEVIVHLYEKHGPAMVDRLNGMFAIALWDVRKRELLVFRDRAGIKPLYYAQVGQRFYFCSEIKGLLQVDEVSRELDPAALAEYLSLQYVPVPRTLFRSIRKLETGSMLRWRAGQIETREFWDYREGEYLEGSGREIADGLYTRLEDSVRRQLVSDVPVGLFLSGGLDSSAIMACAARVHRGTLKAYNIAYSPRHGRLEQSLDDAYYARIVAEACGAELHQIVVEPSVVDDLPVVAYHLDDPVGDPHTVATYLLCKAAKPDVTVLLSGQGADELLGGYRVHMIHRLSKLLAWIPGPVRTGPMMRLLRMLDRNREHIPGIPPGLILGFCRVLEKYLVATGLGATEQFAQARTNLTPERRYDLLAPGMHSPEVATCCEEVFQRLFTVSEGEDPLNRVLYADCKTFLPDLNLNVADKLSMASSIEIRVPFLDNEVIDYMLRVPPEMKIHGTNQKYVLRRAMASRLPVGVLHRRKAAFGLPVRSWMQGELRPMLHDLLSEETVRRRGLLNARAVRRLVDENTSGMRDHTLQLWGLMTLELWMQAHIDDTAASTKGVYESGLRMGCH